MFGRSKKIFTLLGFEVKVDISWLIVAVLVAWTLSAGFFPDRLPDQSAAVYWIMGGFGMLGLFASVIFHELFHSLVARRFGMPMKGITLFIFGGVAEMHSEPPDPRSEFYMAVAGPAASVIIGMGFLLVGYLGGMLVWPLPFIEVLSYLALLNFILAGFNLIPAFPLDGGRVLRSILWKRRNDIRSATKTAARFGTGFGLFMIFSGIMIFIWGGSILGLWWVFLGLFLRGAAQTSLVRLQMRTALKGEPVRKFMVEDPVTVPPSITVKSLVEDYIYKHHYKMYPVIENGELLGLVTTGDVKGVPREHWEKATVGGIMQDISDDNTIPAGGEAVDALKMMRKNHASRLLATEGGGLAGLLSLKDLLNFISLKMDLEEEALEKTARPAGGTKP